MARMEKLQGWRRPFSMLSIAVASTACRAPASPVASPPEVATAETGPAAFDAEAMFLGHWSWDEYARETAAYTSIARLAQPHPRASGAARYGINLHSRGANASWVLDGDAAGDYWLVVDIDLDGNLANDQVWHLRRAASDWQVEVTTPPRVPGGPPARFVVTYDGTDVRARSDVIRTGTIVVAGRALRFAIACFYGDCGSTDTRVGFDLDGDGTVDVATPGSYERYRLRDRTVVAFGRGYDFELAPDGSRLTLRPTQTPSAPRPTLLPGSAAPAFDAAGDHARFSLAAARGRVVLIDFYSAGCHYCVADLPWLAGVHDRYAGAGLDIVTIAAGEPPAGGHAWPTLVEADPGPVAALYRVDAYPAYFVVDRAGTITCARCKHDAVDRALAPLFAPSR